MASKNTAIHKRKREEESSRGGLSSNVENTQTALPSSAIADTTSSTGEAVSAGPPRVTAAVLTACRAALVKSSASSRAILAKHRTAINPDLAKILETVGGFKDEVTYSKHFFLLFALCVQWQLMFAYQLINEMRHISS